MGSRDEVVEEDIDSLERGLLTGIRAAAGSRQATAVESEEKEEEEGVLYAASFEEMEERFIKYQTAQWVMCSLLLISAWGIGLLMLLYLPVRRYILRSVGASFLQQFVISHIIDMFLVFPCKELKV